MLCNFCHKPLTEVSAATANETNRTDHVPFIVLVVLSTLENQIWSRKIGRHTQVRRKQRWLVIQTHAKFAFLQRSAGELGSPDC